jgi:arginine exporter protein ArgO
MKKSNYLLSMILGVASLNSVAQTARLEVIHNSADAAAAVVDIYVNGGLEPFIDDFAFRTSSGFVDVPSGVALSIGVAGGNSTGPGDILVTVPVGPLMSGQTYIAIANGIVSPTGYSPAPSFDLDIFTGAREAAAGGAGTNDVLVYHGSTDAPMVDVDELAVVGGEAVNDLSYSQFQGYLTLGVEDYLLQVQAASSGAAVAAFDAPLATLGVTGAALTVLASGFLDPSVNSNGAAFGLFVSTGAAGALLALPSPEARLEVIHNSADAAAAVVDVFVNGDELIPDFAFRTTSGFITVPAGMPLDIDVAPNGAGIAGSVGTISIPFLASGETYIAIANGIVSPTGYSPAPAFGLDIFTGAREAAAGGAGTNDLLVYHGSTDAPMVDVDELAILGGQAVNDILYSEFQGYLALGVEDYLLQVQAASSGAAVAAFDAPLATLGVNGAALTVLASGFLDPSTNSNGAAFGLFVSTGAAGALLALPSPEARLEVIHNSADAAAAVVDVFVNGDELIPDFAFRTTSGFITVPAGMPLDIDVAPNGAGIAGSVGTISIPFLASGETYIAIANGIVSPTGYSPAPAFGLDIFAGAREEAANQGADETDVLVYHGSTDAPTVDVAETGVGAGTVVNNISYGEFQGYLELGTLNYQLTIQDATGAVNVAAFDAPLETLGLQDAAITVLASGFFDPSMNSNGAGFGLWVSLGTNGSLIPLSNVTGVEDVESISNAALFPNPTNDNATMFFDLVDDTNINLEVVNTMGQRVVVKSFGEMLTGNHRVEIPASELAPGFYFVNLRTDNGVVSAKMQVVK